MKDRPVRIGFTRMTAIIGLVVLLFAGCNQGESAPVAAAPNPPAAATAAPEYSVAPAGVELPHIHGLGFSPDGRQLIVPAHDGLRIYREGKWLIPPTPAHDYMGFAATNDGFYSSGHPHPSAGLVNPLGLIKSTDGGQTLTQLDFAGESDFHSNETTTYGSGAVKGSTGVRGKLYLPRRCATPKEIQHEQEVSQTLSLII